VPNQRYSRREKALLISKQSTQEMGQLICNLLIRLATSTEMLNSLAINVSAGVGADEANVLVSVV
jgi:hypothetical protein